jgi:predicted PurR-regulated permease PerM
MYDLLKNINIRSISKFFKYNKSIRRTLLALLFIVIIITYVLSLFDPFCVLGIIGDCTTKSTSTVVDITNTLSSIDNSIRQAINQSCEVTADANNIINILDSSLNNVSISQQNIIKNICALQSSFSSNVDAESQKKVAAAIAQHAVSKGAFLGSPSNSETVTESINNSSTFINNSQLLESVKKCVMNMELNNIINILNSSVTNSSIEQINNQFFECLASDANTAEIASKAREEYAKQIDQTADASGANVAQDIFNGISSIFGSLNIFFVVLGLAVIVFIYYFSKTATNVVNSDAVKNLATPETIQAFLDAKASASPASAAAPST